MSHYRFFMIILGSILGMSLVLAGYASAQQATAGAGAASDQSQGQSQTANGGRGGSNSLNFNNSFNGSDPIRYLPVPSSVMVDTRGGPNLFGGPNYRDNGPDFVSVRQLVKAMNYVDLNQELVDDGAVDIVVQMLNPAVIKKDEAKKDKTRGEGQAQSPPVNVAFEINDGQAVNNGFKPIALMTMQADSAGEINSATLALAAGKKARELGGSKVVFLTEGSRKELSSWGVGIGLSYNSASVDSSPDGNGSVGAGGFGWSYGKAGYRSLIYLSAFIGN